MSHSDWQSKTDSQIRWCRECGQRFIASIEADTCLPCTREMAENALKAAIGAKLRNKLQN